MTLSIFSKKNRVKGFTLIELMVTVTIMLIMTSVVLFNYNQFNQSSLLSNFAYDMSLTIRQAQVYGVAVKEAPGSTQGTSIDVNSIADTGFSSPYGVHFNIASEVTPFLLFADSNVRDGDGVFDAGDTTLQSYSFQRGITIAGLCVINSANSGICTPVAKLDITFIRPNPEAIIIGTDAGGTEYRDQSTARITLNYLGNSNPKIIEVEATGQISVQ